MQRCRCSCDATNLEGFLDGEPRDVTAEVLDVSAVNLGCKSATLSWWPREKKNDGYGPISEKITWLLHDFRCRRCDRRRLRVRPFLRCRAPPPWLNEKFTQHMSLYNSHILVSTPLSVQSIVPHNSIIAYKSKNLPCSNVEDCIHRSIHQIYHLGTLNLPPQGVFVWPPDSRWLETACRFKAAWNGHMKKETMKYLEKKLRKIWILSKKDE